MTAPPALVGVLASGSGQAVGGESPPARRWLTAQCRHGSNGLAEEGIALLVTLDKACRR